MFAPESRPHRLPLKTLSLLQITPRHLIFLKASSPRSALMLLQEASRTHVIQHLPLLPLPQQLRPQPLPCYRAFSPPAPLPPEPIVSPLDSCTSFPSKPPASHLIPAPNTHPQTNDLFSTLLRLPAPPIPPHTSTVHHTHPRTPTLSESQYEGFQVDLGTF